MQLPPSPSWTLSPLPPTPTLDRMQQLCCQLISCSGHVPPTFFSISIVYTWLVNQLVSEVSNPDSAVQIPVNETYKTYFSWFTEKSYSANLELISEKKPASWKLCVQIFSVINFVLPPRLNSENPDLLHSPRPAGWPGPLGSGLASSRPLGTFSTETECSQQLGSCPLVNFLVHIQRPWRLLSLVEFFHSFSVDCILPDVTRFRPQVSRNCEVSDKTVSSEVLHLTLYFLSPKLPFRPF